MANGNIIFILFIGHGIPLLSLISVESVVMTAVLFPMLTICVISGFLLVILAGFSFLFAYFQRMRFLS